MRDRSTPICSRRGGRTRSAGITNINWQQAYPATTVLDGFDLLTSAFGVMFFGDPVSAFTHMRRAAETGARMAIVCWRPLPENPWMALPMNAINSWLSDQPDDVKASAADSIREALEPYTSDVHVRLPGAMWLIASEPA